MPDILYPRGKMHYFLRGRQWTVSTNIKNHFSNVSSMHTMSSMAGVLYETGTIYPSPEFTNVFLVGSVLLIFLDFCVVLLCVFMFWVPCYDICYDFHIKTMLDSFLPPVICRRARVLFMLFVFVCLSNTYCAVFLFCFSSSCVPYVASFSRLSVFACLFGIL